MRPRLLDLFCGGGGAAMGYYRAGFDIVGVDIAAQPNYPFEFRQGDALEFLARFGHTFDAVHASPPCQGYSRLRHLPWLAGKEWPLLLEPCRNELLRIGKPWVQENVEDAPMPNSFVLCGRMFDLPLYRHRRFESSAVILVPQHQKHTQVIGHGRGINDRKRGTLNAGSRKGAWGESPIVTVAGGQYLKADGERAMGIDWMTRRELSQSIPPAYTQHIGAQLIELARRAA